MPKRTTIIFSIMLMFSLPGWALEVSGVKLAQEIELAGQKLNLNGAGVRSKFIFDIYVGALYLPQKTDQARQAMLMAGPKRVLMHFLYSEVDKSKLVDGWKDGFKNNLNATELASLKERLEEFNSLFITVKKGDEILLDYLPGTGTRIVINQQERGIIAGEDFNRALLGVWLGDNPADSDLKQAMLGKADD